MSTIKKISLISILSLLIIHVAIPGISKSKKPNCYKATFNQPINDWSTFYLQKAIKATGKYDCILVVINTNGGFANAIEQFKQTLQNTDIKTIVWSDRSGVVPAQVYRVMKAGDISALGYNALLRLPDTHRLVTKKREPITIRDYFFSNGIQTHIRRSLSKWFWPKYRRDTLSNDAVLKHGLVDYTARDEKSLLRAIYNTDSPPAIITASKGWQAWLIGGWLLNPDVAYIITILVLCAFGHSLLEQRYTLSFWAGVALFVPLLYPYWFIPVNIYSVLYLIISTFMMVADIYVPTFGLSNIIGVWMLYKGSVYLFAHPAFLVSTTAALAGTTALYCITVFVGFWYFLR